MCVNILGELYFFVVFQKKKNHMNAREGRENEIEIGNSYYEYLYIDEETWIKTGKNSMKF